MSIKPNLKKVIKIIFLILMTALVFSNGVYADDGEKVDNSDGNRDTIIEQMPSIIEKEEIVSNMATSAKKSFAYAVLQDDGDFVFFRSYNSYKNEDKGSFKDTNNNSYSGIIFSDFENLSENKRPTWQVDSYKNSIKKVYVANNHIIHPINMYAWFDECRRLLSFNSRGFDTSNVTDMSGLFSFTKLFDLDLSYFNTANVTDMSFMFGYSSVKEIDLSNFDTSKVQIMQQMFHGCNDLKTLNIDNFDTSNVTNMNSMFFGCESLKSLNVNSFNTSKVHDFGNMFRDCKSLEKINVSNFDVSNAQDLFSMFYGCSSIKELDLSNFVTNNLVSLFCLVENCTSLETLDISNFVVTNLRWEGDNFKECNALNKIKLSKNIKLWIGELPSGVWNNKEKGLSLFSNDLSKNYYKNSNEWFGTWEKADSNLLPCSLNTNVAWEKKRW